MNDRPPTGTALRTLFGATDVSYGNTMYPPLEMTAEQKERAAAFRRSINPRSIWDIPLEELVRAPRLDG